MSKYVAESSRRKMWLQSGRKAPQTFCDLLSVHRPAPEGPML